MTERPNLYLLLDLDPKIDDWPTIEKRLKDKQREWSAQRSGNPKQRRTAESNLARLKEIEAVLKNDESRRQESKEAVRQLQKARQEQARELDGALEVLKTGGGRCTAEQLKNLVQRFSGAFTADEIKKRLQSADVQLEGGSSPDRKPRPAKEKIDRVTAGNVRRNLDHLRLKNLYDFLELKPQSSTKALCDRADEIYRENQRLGRTDADASARNELAGLCRSLFQNDREKTKYDNFLAVEAMESLKPDLELAGGGGFLSRGVIDALVKRARQLGVSAEDARTYIEDYSLARRWGLQHYHGTLPSEKLKLCGFCSELAPATATRCSNGHLLELPCPYCSTPTPSSYAVCPSCGCRTGDAPIVMALLKEGEHLATEGDTAGALRCFAKALLYWPNWMPALEARRRVEEPSKQRQAERPISTLPLRNITNVTSKSFGIVVTTEDQSDAVINLILMDDPVPRSSSLSIETREDGLRTLELHCMENTLREKHVEISQCRDIGHAVFGFDHPLPKGSVIEVTFSLGPDGLLELNARDLTNRREVNSQFQTNAILSQERLEESKRRNMAIDISSGAPPSATPEPPVPPPLNVRAMSRRDQVFISYSHKDKIWLERLQNMLKPLIRQGTISLWDDTKITPGKDWKREIEKALASAKVAALLVSKDFIASDFISENELPPLLRAAEEDGLTIIWLCVGYCLFEETEIRRFQAAHDTSRPLLSLRRTAERDQVLAQVCRRIKETISRPYPPR